MAIIASKQIPGIGPQLGLNRINEAGGPIEAHDFIPAEHKAQQLIEANEVVHVPVRDEDIGDAKEFAGRQRRNISEVEKESAPLKRQVDKNARVPKGIIDQVRIEA